MKASRRDFIKLCGANAAAVGLGAGPDAAALNAALLETLRTASDGRRPNIIYYQVDNLGYGELGCYGGGLLRGIPTQRIDQFAGEGLKLLNFAPEAQCTPSRSALMTGRYSIRSGTSTVALAGDTGGIVAWERTMGDILSDAGYATACFGKWHIGAEDGRWPTDHGFEEWYGIPRSYDECLWAEDPWYDPKRDPVVYVLEGRKGEKVGEVEQLTVDVRRDIDTEYMRRAFDFIRRNAAADNPFYLYHNPTMLHYPTVPRTEFAGRSGNGDWADCLLQMDQDFGALLDLLEKLGVAENTVVIFAGDNGPEEALPWRGTAGFFEGSYFTGMEGSLRTPCLIRWPGRVPAGRESNEVVHITDMFPTLLNWAGGEVPSDRVIDGIDQDAFFRGDQENSNRDGFIFWNGTRRYGIKWRNFKAYQVEQKYFYDPAPPLGVGRIINLLTDPKEREPVEYPYMHTWVMYHIGRMIKEFEASVEQEPPIPAGAPVDYNPYTAKATT